MTASFPFIVCARLSLVAGGSVVACKVTRRSKHGLAVTAQVRLDGIQSNVDVVDFGLAIRDIKFRGFFKLLGFKRTAAQEVLSTPRNNEVAPAFRDVDAMGVNAFVIGRSTIQLATATAFLGEHRAVHGVLDSFVLFLGAGFPGRKGVCSTNDKLA